jgi:cytochrome P450
VDSEFQPAPPQEAQFDAVRNSWILSQYADVYAALREPLLRQVSAKGEFLLGEDEDSKHSQLFAEVQADMSRLNTAEWRSQMGSTAHTLLQQAARDEPIDIVREVIQPWSAAMLVTLSGAAPPQSKRLTGIAASLFFPANLRGTAAPKTTSSRVGNRWRSWHRRRAQSELDRMVKSKELSLSMPMFAGLTQTLPSFLAKSWLALLQHPDEAARLLAEPDLMPGAVEELLRYAGIVHTLYRRAIDDVHIGNIRIVKDQRVILRMGSANYDPAKFPEPNRLDITRRSQGHLGLGMGPHACVGTVLVRMGVATITPIFLAAASTLDPDRPIVWTGDNTLRWPLIVPASLPRRSAQEAGLS